MTEQEMRELDAWIAEHVMGWTRGDVKPSKWFPGGAKNAWLTPRGSLSFVPLFTTNPADAMAVLKKCAEKTDQVSIVVCRYGTWAIAVGDGNEHGVFQAKAETLELAICLMAKEIFK